MKVTILYGTTEEVLRLTTPVLNEVVIQLGILDCPVMIARWCGCHVEALEAMMLDLEETDVGHIIAITNSQKLTAEKMIEFAAACPAIESFRHASSPFHKTNLGEALGASNTIH